MKRILFILILVPMSIGLVGQVKETMNIVKMRSFPAIDSAISYTIPRGSVVTLLNDTLQDKTWSKISFNGNVGYVLSRFLKEAYDPNSPEANYSNKYKTKNTQTAQADSIPAGATAICNDSTYSFDSDRENACSGHGGIKKWIK